MLVGVEYHIKPWNKLVLGPDVLTEQPWRNAPWKKVAFNRKRVVISG